VPPRGQHDEDDKASNEQYAVKPTNQDVATKKPKLVGEKKNIKS